LNLTNQVDGAYEGLLKATPENVPALLDYARWLTPANPQKAIIAARQAYQLKPQDPEVMHVLGRLAYLTGDFSWARILLQLTVQTQPGSAEAQFDLAEALYAVGQVAEARATMQQALPSGGFPRAGLARQFLWLTGLADHSPELLAARERVEQVLKADPDNLPALVVKAMIAEDQTNWAAAERTGEQILRRYPEFTPAQRLLALAYARDPGNDTKALTLAARAHRAFPQDAEVTKLLGILTYRQGNYSGAIAYLQDSARRLPHDAELLYYQGMAKYRLKEFKESKASLQQALLLNLSGVQANEVRQLLAAWPAS
jgi:Flp pilus assembly protein TadD